jgi:outer membrane protein assembly factor BamB
LVAAIPDRYEELARIETIEGVCWNTFCVYGDRVIVRSDQGMACFELPLEEQLNW